MLVHIAMNIASIASLTTISRDAATQVVALGVVAGTAAIGYFFAIRQRRMNERKVTCARAVADALAWLELPYRIRRRVNDDAETLRGLAEHMHQLQESLLFDQSWILIEMPQVEPLYSALVAAVKQNAQRALREAWSAAPVEHSVDMNVGSLDMPSVDPELRRFAEEVRARLAWWKLWQE